MFSALRRYSGAFILLGDFYLHIELKFIGFWKFILI